MQARLPSRQTIFTDSSDDLSGLAILFGQKNNRPAGFRQAADKDAYFLSVF
jgi:hypothetical protein